MYLRKDFWWCQQQLDIVHCTQNSRVRKTQCLIDRPRPIRRGGQNTAQHFCNFVHGSLTHHNVASGAVLVLALGYTEWAQLSNSHQFTGVPLTLAAKHGSVDLVGERHAHCSLCACSVFSILKFSMITTFTFWRLPPQRAVLSKSSATIMLLLNPQP